VKGLSGLHQSSVLPHFRRKKTVKRGEEKIKKVREGQKTYGSKKTEEGKRKNGKGWKETVGTN
jgi:hypothetical protein